MYYRGKSSASYCLVTYASKKRKNTGVKYGITAGKKIGNAVKRNRSKRVIREAFAVLEPEIKGDWDFVFVARTKTSQVKMQQVLNEMRKHFTDLGVID